MPAYRDKIIVLTGASQGIGKALALHLARQGPRLVLAARDELALEEVAAQCRAAGATILVVPTDVGQAKECKKLIERAVEHFGGLDVLINNAGITMMSPFAEVQDLSIFEKLLQVNYLACVYLTHAALPHLQRSRGQIVTVASLAGLTGVPTRTGYCASKHAVIGFFDALRIELRGTGVDVTVIAPDFVVTETHRRAAGPDGRPLGQSPMQEKKIMSAEECGRQIVVAMTRRRRLAILSARGRWGRWVRLLAPGLIDAIAARATRRGH